MSFIGSLGGQTECYCHKWKGTQLQEQLHKIVNVRLGETATQADHKQWDTVCFKQRVSAVTQILQSSNGGKESVPKCATKTVADKRCRTKPEARHFG